MTGYQSYTRTNIQTSDPRAVIVLLYEGAIRYLQQALEALRRDERMRMSEFILKTQKIIQFLVSALNFEQGGELAGNLDRLYCYMRDTLNQANLRCDSTKIQEVIDLFRPLLEAWREIAKDPTAAAALEARANQAVPQTAPVAVAPVSPAPTPLVEAAVSATTDVGDATVVEMESYLPKQADAAHANAQPSNGKKADTVIAGRAAYGLR
jgi:flagellar secretion chaperone FliS